LKVVCRLFNIAYNISDNVYWQVNRLFWSFFIIWAAKLRGITIERNCRFYGRAKLKKANNAAIQIGKKVTFRSAPFSNLIGVNRPCIIAALDPAAVLKIGDNSGFSGTVISCFKSVVIGNNVLCGANTLITDGDWHSDDPRSGAPAEIVIEDNVWLGVNVTVLKGVTIGKNAVIGANSVVVKSIPANCLAVGNPCRVIREQIIYNI
jgi:acetyltransferase-like isoleucine patch superfamily enzyme